MTFGAGDALVQQLVELEAAVRAGRDMTLRDMRHRSAPVKPILLGGSVPADHHPQDRAELVGETVPDGAQILCGTEFEKTWRIRNSGELPWSARWLTRQGTPGVAGLAGARRGARDRTRRRGRGAWSHRRSTARSARSAWASECP